MTTLREKTIDVSNMTENDKIIRNISGDTLSFQVDDNMTITLKGRHIGMKSDNYYNLGVINLTTLTKEEQISAAGLYSTIIEGVDEVKLEITGTSGKIHWKELGD